MITTILLVMVTNAATEIDQDAPVPVGRAVALMNAQLVSSGDARARRFGTSLRPRGRTEGAARIKSSELEDVYNTMKEVFRPESLPPKERIEWSGISNEKLIDEQIIARWSTKEFNVYWVDVEGTTANLTLVFANELLPDSDIELLAADIQHWLQTVLRLLDPLPANYKLWQTSAIGKSAEVPMLHGWIAFPDHISRRFDEMLAPERRWCLSMQFCAMRQAFVVEIPIHWITTRTVWGRRKPYDGEGKPVSRFIPN